MCTLRSFAAQEEGPESNSCRDSPVNRGQTRAFNSVEGGAPQRSEGPKNQKDGSQHEFLFENVSEWICFAGAEVSWRARNTAEPSKAFYGGLALM